VGLFRSRNSELGNAGQGYDALPAMEKDSPMRWDATTSGSGGGKAPRFVPAPFGTAVGRGLRNRCPYCGVGRVFAGYLKLTPECSNCHAPLGRLRADDAPPYFTIFLVGHILVPPVFWVEKAYEPPMWIHMVVWLPLFTILCILLLRPIKGAVVGWMSTLGIVSVEDDEEAPPAAATPPMRRLPDRNA
jgi:uncharacterized protein (DUF983 family)